MALFARGGRRGELQRKADAYVAALPTSRTRTTSTWLGEVATRGDADRARWELR